MELWALSRNLHDQSLHDSPVSDGRSPWPQFSVDRAGVVPRLSEDWTLGHQARNGDPEKKMARREGLEPPTPSSEDWCSIR